jgi:hypothetical protein
MVLWHSFYNNTFYTLKWIVFILLGVCFSFCFSILPTKSETETNQPILVVNSQNLSLPLQLEPQSGMVVLSAL